MDVNFALLFNNTLLRADGGVVRLLERLGIFSLMLLGIKCWRAWTFHLAGWTLIARY